MPFSDRLSAWFEEYSETAMNGLGMFFLAFYGVITVVLMLPFWVLGKLAMIARRPR